LESIAAMTIAAAVAAPQPILRWDYVAWALAAIAVMVAAVTIGNLWFLDFVHVFSSVLWTGIDLFMGFVLGPILRRTDMATRREIAGRLTPRTLVLMPALAIISGTSGWYLAVELGYAALPWPAFGWIAAALLLVTLMTIQGLGFLTPINVLVCLELRKAAPDLSKITPWLRWYFYVIASQGLMQVLIIVIMTRFRTGI
jgi:uncharacterized membrane protein